MIAAFKVNPGVNSASQGSGKKNLTSQGPPLPLFASDMKVLSRKALLSYSVLSYLECIRSDGSDSVNMIVVHLSPA